MAELIFDILWKIFPAMRERYPEGDSWFDAEDALYHINFYLTCGLFGVLLSNIIWPLSVGTSVGWTVGLGIHILFKELIQDGHLKEIWNKSMKRAEMTDFKADLITRFAGLLIPLIFTVIILVR